MVDRVVLVGEKGIEEDLPVDELVDLGERQVLMWKKGGLLALEALEECEGGLCRIDPRPQRSGGDQKAEHALDAWDQRLASGADVAVEDIALVGEACQEDGPGPLQDGGEGEGVLAREGLEPGGELG